MADRYFLSRSLRKTVLNDCEVTVLLTPCQINAETTAGGLSLWLTSEVAGTVRTNATDFTEAYIPYIDAIAKETAPFQVTHGGPVVAVQIGESAMHR